MKKPIPPVTYAATLRYLFALQSRGIKFGLRSTQILLAALGHPERSFLSLHIAGTNGKGSTSSILASVCMESGCRTGLFTSPHLVRFTERIRVDGRQIPEERVVHYTRRLFPLIEALRATFFEAITAIAFRHFADEGVDVAVVEAGMGGRLDSTNVLTPAVSVITTIGLDHTEYLGNSLQAIAREKAGIIKSGVPCVTGVHQAIVLATLRQVARRRKSDLYRVRDLVRVESPPGRDTALRIRGRRLGSHRLVPDVSGAYQAQNVGTAAAVCEVLLRRKGEFPRLQHITRETVLRGMRHVVRNTGLAGRFQVLNRGGRILLDVAHNPAAIHALVASLQQAGERNLAVLFGVMKDKDYAGMLKALAPVTKCLIPARPATPRALALSLLRKSARGAGIRVMPGGAVAAGLREALRRRVSGETLLVTGSHYVVGEALRALSAP